MRKSEAIISNLVESGATGLIGFLGTYTIYSSRPEIQRIYENFTQGVADKNLGTLAVIGLGTAFCIGMSGMKLYNAGEMLVHYVPRRFFRDKIREGIESKIDEIV